ncbi:hypothetical protein KR018_009367 [Drosophila ironensis]|nr:hypothetical protein KR018_009367 [Drosophila ironensis]
MPFINLESSDGVIYAVDLRIAKGFGIIRTMMQTNKMPEDQSSVVLPKVNGAILLKLISWAEYHVDDPEPTDDFEFFVGANDSISAWDANFLRVDHATLVELIVAANYLKMKSLQKAACKTVANRMKGKSVEEIRKAFNIESDFSPEEEEQMRLENEWVEE